MSTILSFSATVLLLPYGRCSSRIVARQFNRGRCARVSPENAWSGRGGCAPSCRRRIPRRRPRMGFGRFAQDRIEPPSTRTDARSLLNDPLAFGRIGGLFTEWEAASQRERILPKTSRLRAKSKMTENAVECAVCKADSRPSSTLIAQNAWSQNPRAYFYARRPHIRPCFCHPPNCVRAARCAPLRLRNDPIEQPDSQTVQRNPPHRRCNLAGPSCSWVQRPCSRAACSAYWPRWPTTRPHVQTLDQKAHHERDHH